MMSYSINHGILIGIASASRPDRGKIPDLRRKARPPVPTYTRTTEENKEQEHGRAHEQTRRKHKTTKRSEEYSSLIGTSGYFLTRFCARGSSLMHRRYFAHLCGLRGMPSSISSIAPQGSRRCTAGPSAYWTFVHTLECYEWLGASGERRSRGGWPLFSSRHLCRPGLGSWPSGTPAAHYSIVPKSCLITSSSGSGSGPTDGIPAMPNGIQELPAGTFALHVAGVFVDGRPAHIHSHPLALPIKLTQRFNVDSTLSRAHTRQGFIATVIFS